MRKSTKIVGGILAAVALVVVGVLVAAFVAVVRDDLPGDSARVVETADYRFDAPDGWVTTCADRAPGCLAVASNNYQWSNREYLVEAQSVDSTGVADSDSFARRATEVAAALVQAGGGKPQELISADESPVAFEGTELFDLEDTTAPRFSRSRFVRFPDGNVTRFTCYGEKNAADKEHDDTCFAALEGLHFPAAAAAEQERLAHEQEQQAAESAAVAASDARDDETFGREEFDNSDPNGFFGSNTVKKLWEETKDLLKAPAAQQK